MNKSRSDNELQAALHRGDPAGDDNDLSRQQIAELRRTVLNAIPDRRRIRWVPIAAAFAATALALVLLSPARLGRQAADAPLATAATEEVDSAQMTAGHRRQQIQFATEKGTRIIWVLDPDLNL